MHMLVFAARAARAASAARSLPPLARLAALWASGSRELVTQPLQRAPGAPTVLPSATRERAGLEPQGPPGAAALLDKLFSAPLQAQTDGRLQDAHGGGAVPGEPWAAAGAMACTPLLAPGAASSAGATVTMEAAVTFDACWRRLQLRHGTALRVPREVIFLNGAPGSGKGMNCPHIVATRGLAASLCVSSLLTAYSDARRFTDAGELIPDAVVGDALLEALLGGGGSGGGWPATGGSSGGGEAAPFAGVVVDGFPRTAVQVDFLKLLHDKLTALHSDHAHGSLSAAFPRPSFKVVVLYVDEDTSVSRQLQRAAQTHARNRRALDAGAAAAGALPAARATDMSAETARKRYTVFRTHYSAILRLKQFFPFHLIDAMGSLTETQSQIESELRYQSSLDLSEDAYGLVAGLPLARELQQQARQQLVSRLEGYASRQRPLFARVLAAARRDVLPLLRRGGLAGRAEWVTGDGLFTEHPAAADMLLDVLSDRGFQASHTLEEVEVPVTFDTTTGRIATAARARHRFHISFEAAGVRDSHALRALEISARVVEAARAAAAAAGAGAGGGGGGAALAGGGGGRGGGGQVASAPITASFIPQHLDHSLKPPPACAGGACGCAPGGECAGGVGAVRMTRCTHPDPVCAHAEEVEVLAPRAAAAGQ